MDEEKARFVPKGSGGYFCTIEIERVENGCVIRLINTNLEDFAFLMGYEKWLPFKIDGVLVCQGENPKTVKFMKGGVALNYIDAVKFMETRRRFKKI
ncbi:TPA: hypothetical protein DIU27_03900 [Candidatus Collierbacteria bacterium]|uniref:Uncharacterized protein n=1 Tax=Candidatus Collierbacteria bacterium GW2011_GWB2_44_22 TaxID=1618387 RepID=A0A0G1K4B2_9BACT|nr:MAG: hypothetical protein UW31_C0003G0075 [Candidatus Collierbacteria bacterium GW2011_GWA2_44_13]KKT51092.1 MAG: hypothetical protein UW44_C0016G0003 [Candidatus Collierbacteria bacterium GW2011_GWB2_44_22]KKT61978.1 MAG: hypothetical protein UW56_C0014G0023 [Candidatus Collierbacteria bacterium GW2011_GWD1_44_27]KKT65601.1 MAG: hypothetical protein UW58_C0025G0015 [Candidatus Collierbacteria bacterium GW2011_GWC2_44_30]KKT68173.1 MAG: hypothetical protein UW64_C0027G0003 [Microgenomates gr